jgi:bacterioferritin-associated ferredoxin
MDLDEEICHCNHVSLRKLINFARRTRPAHASQMSECLGAGTGCGKCAPKLRVIAELADRPSDEIIRELVARWPYG